MRLELKVIGDQLYEFLLRDATRIFDSITHLCCSSNPVQPKLSRCSDKRQIGDLLTDTSHSSLILLEVNNFAVLESLQGMERKELAFLGQAPNGPRLVPLIAVFASTEILADVRDLPDLISDWVFLPLEPVELARRIFSVLKRRDMVKTKVLYGELSLNSETRSLVYFGNNIHLTKSEFALLELFLSQMGTVIPLADLAMLFKSTGKSTEGSNIRVTVFQLRLKLEMLTKGQYTVMSVYKQGYCLKQKSRSTIKEISDGLDARHRGSPRLVG